MILAASSDTRLNVVRWAGLLGMVGGAAWVVKVLYIVVALEPEEHDIVTTVLYITGFVVHIGAAVGIAVWMGRSLAARAVIYLLVVLLHVFTITFLSEGVEALADPLLTDTPHLVPEVPVALIGLIWLFLGHRMWTHATGR